MGKIYAGTSGWAYGSWKPKFYPRKLGASRFLNYYATRLNSVEVNYTFSKDVSAELLRGWVADTPEDFVFAVKAHRRITHMKRLRGEALQATADFLRLAGTITRSKEARAGAVPASSQFQVRCGEAARLSRRAAAGIAGGVRIPA